MMQLVVVRNPVEFLFFTAETQRTQRYILPDLIS
jgi:hypothetical protein